ncbi:hypothetical protein [Mesorhizobium sp. NZP2298]|uniref:hypothetical protein n=1 Tax=Mesorhizobium sp. NZP2298 TaxID=2483403 RepID=UPI0015544721|nr:hypothetical protein [Mesorhizobium sp. NZP2298]QKC98267.1 hypothetical protein EB231_29175 [Mesorhizobium sp. NZP2298]
MADLKIDDFLSEAAPDSERDLARVNIAGGDQNPFYIAQLRSFWREYEDDTRQVVDESFGLRSLLVDASARDILNPKTAMNPPTLLRAYPRSRQFAYDPGHGTGVRSRRLFLWSTKAVILGRLEESSAAFDLMVVPTDPWPETNKGSNVRLPAMRLVDGIADVRLDLKNAGLGTFFSYSDTKGVKTLFGGLVIQPQKDLLDARLVPTGIEFKGSLPDPTRDFGGNSTDLIQGTFRLECDARGLEPQYLLRLVAADKQENIDKTEGRIALALAELSSASAPVAIRYDKRPVVPPLSWRLKQGDKALTLVKNDQDFEMRIDASAIDVRIRTEGISSDERGLATIFAKTVTWVRMAKPTVELTISAGVIAMKQEPSPGDVEITFDNDYEAGWTAALADIKNCGFSAPLRPVVERLLPIYQEGGAIGQGTDEVPYVFLPVQEGWLQIASPGSLQHTLRAVANDAAAPDSAMSGRIFVSHENSNRGVVIDDASAIELKIGWSAAGTSTPSLIKLRAGTPKGQLLGMIYVSESSPNAREALPTLRGGPASTRDLPLWFGAEPADPCIRGDFDWNHDTGVFSARITGVPVPTDGEYAALSWLPPADSAYISNFALTRSLPSAPDPSVSRGLLPRRILPRANPTFQLSSNPGSEYLPKLTAANTKWFRFLAKPEDGGTETDDDRLVLVTLSGTEFRSSADYAIDKAILRFDLPVLDELFAWSDPPKLSAASPPVTTTKPPALPTALQPGQLADSWQASRNRMALTRTQDAEVTDWLDVGKNVNQAVGGLVAPYEWSVKVEVHPEAMDGWGEYLLEKVRYSKDRAAEGLGGEKAVPFYFDGGEIKVGDGAIQVEGYAANLFKHSASMNAPERLWDSRGFGLSSQLQKGIRGAAYLADAAKDEKSISLLTSSEVAVIEAVDDKQVWSFAAKLGFFVRDLPLDNMVFDGENKLSIESACGTDGQAFNADHFPYSLYEWRFFEIRKDGGPKPYDIRWGPFTFKPLRLRKAIFDKSGKPTVIAILGGLRFDPDSVDADPKADGPFGQDEVYARRDLFTLTLTLADGHWSYAWAGTGVSTAGDTFTFSDRTKPTVTFQTSLGNTGRAFFKSVDDVQTIVSVNVANDKPTADFTFRLFGTDFAMTDTVVVPTPHGFTVELPVEMPSAPLSKGATCVVFYPRSASVSIDGKSRTLTIEGEVRVYPQPGGKTLADECLVTLEKGRLTWLGLPIPVNDLAINVDHQAGVLSWRLDRAESKAAMAPFGFQANGLTLSAVLTAAAPVVAGAVASRISSFDMASAWMEVRAVDAKQPESEMEHALLASADGQRDHSLHISWAKRVKSPIQWPVRSQFQDATGKSIPDTWLRPDYADQTVRSRELHIAASDGSRLEHEVVFVLNQHRIDGDCLASIKGVATVSQPVRLLVVAAHALGQAGAQSQWTTLDHLVITTAKLITAAKDARTFAALESNDNYRGEKADVHNGIATFPTAVSGFFDDFLIEQWWSKGDDAPLFIGGAVAQFPDNNAQTYSAVVPWADLSLAKSPIGEKPLNTKAGVWQVASADLWPATPQKTTGPIANVTIGSLAEGAAIDAAFVAGPLTSDGSDSDPRAREVIPVEQAYFEKRKSNAGVPLEPADLEAAPFFLRAMVAIAARRDLDKVGAYLMAVDWKASTLQGGRFLATGSVISRPATPAVRVIIRSDTTGMSADPQAAVFADLIVLSRGRATRLDRYRRVLAGGGDDLSDKVMRDELVEAALNVDANALMAIRMTSAPGDLPGVALRRVSRPLAGLVKGAALTPAESDVSPSAALGWPTGQGTQWLAQLGPALGDEVPLLGHDSGFAGRFQMFGWPAFAPASSDAIPISMEQPSVDPAGLYLTFANQIAYDRGAAAKFGFDGPAARHLLPSVARRRAPLSKATEAVLETVLHTLAPQKADATVAIKADGKPQHKQAAAILPPVIERGTIGRRPGVIDVSVASLTVPADEAAFDEGQVQFGRPANSGPVVAHQLRNPRSPVLPADLMPPDKDGKPAILAEIERITFGLRRRTYVSLADFDEKAGRLALFHAQDGLADAARFEYSSPDARRHDRALFTLKGGATISASWNGLAQIAIEVASRMEGAGVEQKLTASGRIEIGSLSFPVQLSIDANGPFASSLDLRLATSIFYVQPQDGLGDVQMALREANADTHLRLVVDLKTKEDGGGGGPPGDLPDGPRRQILLPLQLDPGARRVLPVWSKTVLFGDPSYDRQLASPTASDAVGGAGSFMLAADRVAYDLGSTLYFAGGLTATDDGEFVKDKGKYEIGFSRLPPRTLGGDQPPPEPLVLQGIAPDNYGRYSLSNATVFEVALANLVSPSLAEGSLPGRRCPLAPGDRLQLVAGKAMIQVDIVAEPVIGPPPSVFSVVETSKHVARVRVHAAAPLPQKIEFPGLLRDLALGHVRRRALFVWSYALAGAETKDARIDLLKFDRSGGAQISDS